MHRRRPLNGASSIARATASGLPLTHALWWDALHRHPRQIQLPCAREPQSRLHTRLSRPCASREGPRQAGPQDCASGFWLRAVGTLGRELIKLGLVLGHAKPGKEFLKCAVLFFQAAQGLSSIFIKCPVAARSWLRPPVLGLTHVGGAIVPATDAKSTTHHSSTPHEIGQDSEFQRPPEHQCENRQTNPHRSWQFFDA